MAKRGRRSFYEPIREIEPSRGTIDPYYRLAAGVVGRSVKDLQDPDNEKALGAMRFLMTDGETWLDALGYDVGSDDILRLLK